MVLYGPRYWRLLVSFKIRVLSTRPASWIGDCVIPLVFLIVFLAFAVHLASRGDALCGALIGLGALGFFGAVLLPATGAWLQHVELPPFFETTSIVGPGGRTFAATRPLARIQRYDSDGRFEAGWFVDTGGGPFAIGLTMDGRIAVAAGRTKRVEFFDQDGSSTRPSQPFTCSSGSTDGVLRPWNCQVDFVALADPHEVGHPGAHWATLVLFPLWDPLVAWLLMVSGILGVSVNRHKNNNADVPLS